MHTPTLGESAATASTGTVEESVLSSLMSIGRLMRQRVSGDELDTGLVWLLKTLTTRDTMRVTELAALADLDASTVSRHVQQLHRAGLIERTPDPDDGRAQQVTISTAGRQRLREGMQRRKAALSKSLDGWDRNDIAVLDQLLGRFVAGLEQNTGSEQR